MCIACYENQPYKVVTQYKKCLIRPYTVALKYLFSMYANVNYKKKCGLCEIANIK